MVMWSQCTDKSPPINRKIYFAPKRSEVPTSSKWGRIEKKTGRIVFETNVDIDGTIKVDKPLWIEIERQCYPEREWHSTRDFVSLRFFITS